jgi:hypothetical protein
MNHSFSLLLVVLNSHIILCLPIAHSIVFCQSILHAWRLLPQLLPPLL